MAVYQAPEGYSFDPASGLWVKKMVVSDKAGVQYDHRYYFNADTGEYRQESFALSEESDRTKDISRKLRIAIPVLLALVAVAFVISYIRGMNFGIVHFSDEELEELERIYELDSVVESTIFFSDYDGEINEEGIIR